MNRKCRLLLHCPSCSLKEKSSLDYIRFYHLRTYDRINAPYGKRTNYFVSRKTDS